VFRPHQLTEFPITWCLLPEGKELSPEFDQFSATRVSTAAASSLYVGAPAEAVERNNHHPSEEPSSYSMALWDRLTVGSGLGAYLTEVD